MADKIPVYATDADGVLKPTEQVGGIPTEYVLRCDHEEALKAANNRRDNEWSLALAESLGSDARYDISIVPKWEAFNILLAQIHARVHANPPPESEDIELINYLRSDTLPHTGASEQRVYDHCNKAASRIEQLRSSLRYYQDEASALHLELDEGDSWMKRATEYEKGGNCPSCFASDEVSHREGCAWGAETDHAEKAEKEAARVKKLLRRETEDYERAVANSKQLRQQIASLEDRLRLAIDAYNSVLKERDALHAALVDCSNAILCGQREKDGSLCQWFGEAFVDHMLRITEPKPTRKDPKHPPVCPDCKGSGRRPPNIHDEVYGPVKAPCPKYSATGHLHTNPDGSPLIDERHATREAGK